MRYQKIHSQIWNDEKFIQLTPSQQRLFFYLLTCPHGNILGLYVLKEGYACEDLKSFPKDFRKDLAKLIEMGLIEYDFNVSVVFIKNFLKHNPITNPNQIKAAIKIIKELPKTYLIQRLKGLIKGLPEGLFEGLPEGLSKPDTDTETETEYNIYVDLEKSTPETKCLSLEAKDKNTEAPKEEDSPLETKKENTKSSKEETPSLEAKENKNLKPEDIETLFKKTCPNLTPIRKLTKERREKILARLKTYPELEFWREVFEKANQSYIPPTDGHPKGWKPDFDYLIRNDTNPIKVLEGKFIQKPKSSW